MKKMILIGAGAVLLLGGTAGGVYFVMKPDPAMAVAGAPEAAMPAARDVFYYNIQPEFVVNFKNKSRTKFLMVEMTVATHDEKVTAIIDDHMPELRNDLLMLLAEQDSETLNTAEGKLALREDAKMIIDELVAKFYAPERINDVFVTRLVMQ